MPTRHSEELARRVLADKATVHVVQQRYNPLNMTVCLDTGSAVQRWAQLTYYQTHDMVRMANQSLFGEIAALLRSDMADPADYERLSAAFQKLGDGSHDHFAIRWNVPCVLDTETHRGIDVAEVTRQFRVGRRHANRLFVEQEFAEQVMTQRGAWVAPPWAVNRRRQEKKH